MAGLVVVPAGDADVLGDAQASVDEAADGPGGHGVVGGDDGRRQRFVLERADRLVAGPARPVAVDDAGRLQSQPLDRLQVGRLAGAGGGELEVPGHVEEPAVPEFDQALHELDQRRGVGQFADAAHLVVEVGRDDDRLPGRRLVLDARQDRGQREDALDLPGARDLEQALGAGLGAADDAEDLGGVAGLLCGVGGAVQHPCRVECHGRHEDRQAAGAAGPHRPGDQVGAVVQLAHGRVDARERVRFQAVPGAQVAGHGLVGDAGQSGHLPDRRTSGRGGAFGHEKSFLSIIRNPS